jgi:uncharacterized FAD-dependent dehydrogenase
MVSAISDRGAHFSMSRIVDFFVPLAASDEPIAIAAARALRISPTEIRDVRLLRRSLDARKAHALGHRLRVEVFLVGEPPAVARPAPTPRRWPSSTPRPRIVIVGSGPAGAWAALRLAEAGVPSTILERGKPVQARRHDLARLQRGCLDESSNYCFGEGGAGTYSDGKLYTRTRERGAVAQVLADFVRFGACATIAVESRPHIGSNRLPKVLSALRTFLEAREVCYRFSSQFAEIVARAGRICAVRTTAGDEIPADIVLLASGHSARDVYGWAARVGIALERKGSAVGVRLEHPQAVIDRVQYGAAAGDPRLPPAFYETSAVGEGRGVYSFCMCPGGFVVPAATEADGVVLNGVSLARRNSPHANAAIVVALSPADYGPAALGPLAGVELQRAIERAAFAMGGGGFRVPAQRLGDFLARRPSGSLPRVSYHPGALPGRIDEVFPGFITSALRAGLAAMTGKLRGFLHDDAVLLAAETRTSAPLRIVRDPKTRQSPSLTGLYPVGEGAGYAGGIVSSAIDGIRAAESILATV